MREEIVTVMKGKGGRLARIGDRSRAEMKAAEKEQELKRVQDIAAYAETSRYRREEERGPGLGDW